MAFFLRERRGGPRFGGEEKGPLGVPIFGIRKFLSEWKPLIPERPKVFSQVVEIGGVPIPFEKQVEIVAKTDWAQNLATGWLKAFMPTLTPGTPEYIEAHERIARRVAEGVLR